MEPWFKLLLGTIPFTMFNVTAAATSVTYNIGYGTASVLTLETATSRLHELLALVVQSLFYFLQHTCLAPSWVVYMLVAACIVRSSPPRTIEALDTALVALVNALAYVYQIYLEYQRKVNSTIVALRKEVADLQAGAVLPKKFKHTMMRRDNVQYTLSSYQAHASRCDQQANQLREQNQSLRDANTKLQNDLDDALYRKSLIENSNTVKQRRADDKLHKLEKTRLNEIIIDQVTQITDLQSKADFWKTQLEQHDCTNFRKLQREVKAEIDSKNEEIKLYKAKADSLKTEKQHMNTIVHGLQQQVALFNSLKELFLRLVEIGNERQQIAVIICLSFFLSSGIDITELGVDPLQRQTYFDWAAATIDGLPSAIQPTTGLRLKGTRFELSRSFVRDKETFVANKAFFGQAICSPQTHWSTLQHTATIFSNPHNALNSSTDTSSATLFQSFQAPKSSTPPSAYNPTAPSVPSAGFGSSAPSDAEPDTPAPASKPDFLSFLSKSSLPSGAPLEDAKPAADQTSTGASDKGKGKDPAYYGDAAASGTNSWPPSGSAPDAGDDETSTIDPDDFFKLGSEKPGC